MKKIKLSHDQIRRYRSNRFALLDSKTGEFVRYANTEESKAATHAHSKKRNIKVRDGERILNFKADRDRMKEELLSQHGEDVRAFDRSMRPLFFAKTFVPTVHPNEKPTAPHPNRCNCAEWEGRPDGKHHPLCKFNKIASDEHRSDLKDIELTENVEPEKEPLHELAHSPEKETPEEVQSSTIEMTNSPPPPSECPDNCYKWKRPDGFDPEQHHPSCSYYEAWRSYDKGELPYFIYTMSGTLMRPATPEEKKEAKQRLETVGSPTIVIGKEEFLCLNEEP